MEPSVGPAPTDFCCSTAAKDRFLTIKKFHRFLERILPFAVFGALWYLLIRHLSVYWITGALSKWHDPAGFAILSICFFVLWGAYPFNFANSCETGAFKGIRPETVSSGE
jgi:hypothetical protein